MEILGEPELKVRKISIEDERELVLKVGRLFASHPLTNGFKVFDEMVLHHNFFVLENNKDEIVAAASGCTDEVDSTMFRLFNFIVRTESRGSGIGTFFLTQIQQEARKLILSATPNVYSPKMRVIPGGGTARFYIVNGWEYDGIFAYKSL